MYVLYLFIVICAAFLWSVPIDKARVDVLDHISNVLGQFIIWHALTNVEWYILWRNHARLPSRHNNVETRLTIGCYVEQPKFNVVLTLQFLRWICNIESTLILHSGNNVENSNVVSTLNIQPSQFKGDELLKAGWGGGGIWNSWVRPF